ncbi:uncharacterized protein LOC132560254 [Ylistrum balloti]|uniref:uncharacterized protein LOC132560254 n=1 Tax=Ylistrum balloti TaxID=509963 RepID=UPI0029059DB9|nr:uncharacterized protein LOC132560254 [Ylistrum balloti]
MKPGLTVWYCIICLFTESHLITADPCLSYEEFQVDYRRSPGHIEDVYEEGLCDVLVRENWYRFVGEADGDLTNDINAVKSNGCGTFYPLWMDGQIPEVTEGIVDRKVCMKSVFSSCHTSFTIQVKNCCTYIVYYLQSASACPSSYCVSPSHVNGSDCSNHTLHTTTVTSPVEKTTTRTISRTTNTTTDRTAELTTVRETSPQTTLVTSSVKTRTTTEAAFDPCLSYEEFQVDYRRSPGHIEDVYEEGLCDVLVRENWYRFVGEADGDLTTDINAVKSNGCGTFYPLWMDGEIPDIAEGIVDRKVCTKSVFSSCHNSFTIQVKNCCSYRVYYLQSASSCPCSYCVSPSYINGSDCSNHTLHTTTMTSPVEKTTTRTISRTTNTTTDRTAELTTVRETSPQTTLVTSSVKTRTTTETESEIQIDRPFADLNIYMIILIGLVSIVLMALTTLIFIRYVFSSKTSKLIYQSNPDVRRNVKDMERLIIVCAVCIILPGRVASDPCTTYENFTADSTRSPSHIESVYANKNCDAVLTTKWYRLVGDAGTDLTNDSDLLVTDGCGTTYQLWMNGSLPDESDGTVNVQICMKSVFSICHSSFTIQVKNCCSFCVYHLQSATNCPQAYCVSPRLVPSDNCPASTTTSSSGVTTTSGLSTTKTTSISTTTKSSSTSKIATGDLHMTIVNTIDPQVIIIVVLLLVVIVVIMIGIFIYKCHKSSKVSADRATYLTPVLYQPQQHGYIDASSPGPNVEKDETATLDM